MMISQLILNLGKIFLKFGMIIKNLNISKLEACIGFVKQFKEIDKIIVGMKMLNN